MLCADDLLFDVNSKGGQRSDTFDERLFSSIIINFCDSAVANIIFVAGKRRKFLWQMSFLKKAD